MFHITFPGRFRPLYFMSIIYIGTSFLLRLILWKLFGPSDGLSGTDVVSILSIGILNDCMALIFLNIPMTVYLAFMPDSLAHTKGQRIGFSLLIFFSLFSVLCLDAAEYLFFQKFDIRFNPLAAEFLLSPLDLLSSIWKSYPIIWIMLTNALLAALLLFKSWPSLDQAFELPSGFKHRMAFLGGYTLLLIPALWLSTAGFNASNNPVENELAHNGIHSLFQAFYSTHPHSAPARQLKNPTQHCTLPKKQKEPTPSTRRTSSKTSKSYPATPLNPTHASGLHRGEDDRPILGKLAILTLFYKGSL